MSIANWNAKPNWSAITYWFPAHHLAADFAADAKILDIVYRIDGFFVRCDDTIETEQLAKDYAGVPVQWVAE